MPEYPKEAAHKAVAGMLDQRIISAARKALRKGELLHAPGGLTLDPSTVISLALKQQYAKLDGWRATLNDKTASRANKEAAHKAIARYFALREEFSRA